MDGLEKVRKKDFIKIFMKKYPETNPKELEKDLTTINKQRNIALYHNQGFLFELKGLCTKDKSVVFGDYVSSFNINGPHEMITVGGNYASDNTNKPHAIHPNIYMKWSNLKLPTVKYNQVIQLCFSERQKPSIDELAKKGLLYSVFDMVNHIFSNTERNDGLWHLFKFPGGCDVCEDRTLDYYYKNGRRVFRCKKCKDAMNPNPVNEVVDDKKDQEEEDDYDDDGNGPF